MTSVVPRRRFWSACGFLVAILMVLVQVGYSQNPTQNETFKARLSPVPIDASMMATVAGFGSLTAVLTGKRLTITGTFEGLRSPATSVQVHRGIKGVRGPAVLDLTVSKSEKGTVSGALELTPEQIADLRNELWYVQIQSERAPDGNLWGWLLH